LNICGRRTAVLLKRVMPDFTRATRLSRIPGC
jgi:hypothetical protein